MVDYIHMIKNMILNFFSGCRYFCLGIIELNRLKRTQTFTKVFPGIGKMTGRGVNVSKCREWYMTIPHYLCWDNVKVCIKEELKNDNDLEVFAMLYKMMNDQADEIFASVKSKINEPSLLKNVDQVEMELHIFDFDGKTKHQYVCLSYNTDRFYATIFVEDECKDILVDLNSNV